MADMIRAAEIAQVALSHLDKAQEARRREGFVSPTAEVSLAVARELVALIAAPARPFPLAPPQFEVPNTYPPPPVMASAIASEAPLAV